LEKIAQHIEALIFASREPLGFRTIKECLEETFETIFDDEMLLQTLHELKEKFQEETAAFELVEIAEGFQFLTKGAYHATIGTYLRQTTKKRLSQAALETLSIVAYKQPVSKTELEQIRGVSCDYALQKLLEKELVAIAGRAETPGRPLLYATSEKFMDYFGIKSLRELPKLKDFQENDNTIGEISAFEDVPKNEND
jgi:segregation and condensation protein B